MTDLKHIREAAHVVKNEDGRTVVQVPVDVWEDLLAQIESNSIEGVPQHTKIKALLAEWETDEDIWWDDFRGFLNENRPEFPEHRPHNE